MIGAPPDDCGLVPREVKRLCKTKSIRLSGNAFQCLNDLCRGMCAEMVAWMGTKRRANLEDHLRAGWAGLLGSAPDDMLMNGFERKYRIFELHWSCQEKHIKAAEDVVCCDEIRHMVSLFSTSNRSNSWIGTMSTVAMICDIVEWLLQAASLLSSNPSEYASRRTSLGL